MQSVLDRKEDVFVQVKSKGPDGKERTSFVSARGEADRLIGKMDAEGWDTYELQYGGLAKGKLAEYKKSADPQVLHEVVQRYFHTAGGAEAADLLATYKRSGFESDLVIRERLPDPRDYGFTNDVRLQWWTELAALEGC